MKTLSLVLIAATLIFTGCATNTGDPAKDARGRVTNEVGKQLFNAVLNFGLGQGAEYLSGRNGQDAAAGAFAAASQGLDIGKVIDAAAGSQVADAATKAYADAKARAPQASPSFLKNVIGAGLQLAANQLAK